MLENEFAALAHEKRVQTADPAVLLGLGKSLPICSDDGPANA